MSDDRALAQAIQRAEELAERLSAIDSPMLQQFGKQIRYALALADESTTVEEVEDTIAVILRLTQSYGFDT